MMNPPRLSIIVPIYNVEAYLPTCIHSILQQTFTDFELILVDDGSPDKCDTMCDEYAKNDDRIIVIHKKNGGLSSARNAGLDIARGDYITFIDSDDEYGTHTTIEENIQILLEDLSIDIVQFPIAYIDSNGNVEIKHNPEEDVLIYSEEEYLKLLFEYKMTHPVCNKIYKKHLFETLRFPMGKIHEDFFLHLDISDKFNKIILSNNSFYNYYERKGSIINSKYSRGKVINLLDAEIIFCKKLSKIPSLSRLFILRYSRNISRIRTFKKEYDLSEIESVFYSIHPPLLSILANCFVPKPKYQSPPFVNIILFLMHIR